MGRMGHIEDSVDAFPCGPDYGSTRIIVRAGMWMRLSRNVDKEQGFLNGDLCQVSITTTFSISNLELPLTNRSLNITW